MLSQPLIDSFVESHSSYNTRKAYRSYLKKFKEFLDKGNIIFDTEFRNKLIVNLNNTLVSPNPYSLLKSYYLFLQKEYEDLNPKVKDAHHYTAFSFFYANDIIINTKYLNKSLQHNKEEGTSGDSLNSVSKKFIIKFLNHCNDKRLKLWVLWLASTGWRAEEPLLLRWRDILEPSEDFPQPRAYLKSSKTDRRRIRPIPHELYDQLMIYKKDKYSPIHTTVLQDNGKRKMYYGNRLEYDPDQLIFSTENEVYKAMDETKKIRKEAKEANKKVRLKMERKSYNIYKCLWRGFNRVRQNLDINDINEENLRNEFVPNSFRHYVRTYVNKLVNRDFSEWYIGHKISTYDDLRVNEGMSTLEDFKIIEKEFTFLDATILDNTLKEERERIKKLEEDKVKQLKDIEELKQKIELQKNHDEELRNEIKQVKKNRMIDLFEIEFSNMTEEIQNNYETLT